MHLARGDLHRRVSYRTLARWTALCSGARLGVVAAKRNTDKCLVDQVWDHVMSQRTRRLIREQCQELEHQLPWYFDGFDLHFEDVHVPDPLFVGHSSLALATGWLNHIMQHPVAFEGRRRELTDAARVALEGVEAVAMQELSGPDGLVELIFADELALGTARPVECHEAEG